MKPEDKRIRGKMRLGEEGESSIPVIPETLSKFSSTGRISQSERQIKTNRTFNKPFTLLDVTVCLIIILNGVNSQSLFGGLCPDHLCECGLDFRGRMEVACLNGRLRDFPAASINPSVEIIKIVPPIGQANHLTIGGFFRRFKKLEELHMVNSNIPSIGEHSFWGMQSLRVLNLTSNNISIIVDANFKGLVSLETLSLADNVIESLVSSSFKFLVKLKSLNLSKNRISKLSERLFINLHMLESLDVSENWLRELHPDVFRDVWRLKELRCRRCGLKSINPMLYSLLPDLQVLDLGENDFKHLDRDEFGALIRLHELRMDGNQITVLKENTFISAKLHVLSVGSNRISRIDKKAFFNSSIGELDISGNKFDTLDKYTFIHIRQNLTKLDLSSNPRLGMSNIMTILGELPNLKSLSLANNEYDGLLLELFESQSQLEYLNLSGNRLTDIYPHQIAQLMSLRVLDLSRNKFKGIESPVLDQFDRLPGFREIYLHGNDWACDRCYIPPLLKWVRSNSLFRQACANPNGEYCLRCASPPEFYDQALLTLDEMKLDWCTPKLEPASISADDPGFLSLFIGCALILIILIVAALLIIFHSRWHAAHYYTHEEDRPEIGTPPLPPDYDNLGENEIVPGFDNLYFSGKHGSNGKQKMIATIEEMRFDPSLTTFSTGHAELTSFHHGNQGRNASKTSATSPTNGYKNGAGNNVKTKNNQSNNAFSNR